MLDERIERIPATGIDESHQRREATVLLAAIFLVAGCGLIYELLIATVSSYLLGSSVTQFSLAIGTFVGAMGLGSHLSQYVHTRLLERFVLVEVVLACIGGASVPLLYWTYATGPLYTLVLYAVLATVGALTGLELPLVTRLLGAYGSLREVIARALSFDYVGALVGSLVFPLVLLPALGLVRTALAVALVNLAVALWTIRLFWGRLPGPRLLGLALAVAALLGTGFAFSFRLTTLLEERLYEDEVVYTEQTPYQRIVFTRWREDLRLFLDGNLQFAAIDEYRYHETLVHPALALAAAHRRAAPLEVLILGGGDGLAAREVLKYPGARITLVDLDPRMTALARTYPGLVRLNGNSLANPRVQVINADAHKYLEAHARLFDVILVDLPDPNTDVLARLYSREFYRLVGRHLAADGLVAVQATSPLAAREAYWCIVATLEAAGLATAPYHTHVPSFGDWGFVLAGHRPPPDLAALRLAVPTRYLNPAIVAGLSGFGGDTERLPITVSTLDRPTILQYYLRWRAHE